MPRPISSPPAARDSMLQTIGNTPVVRLQKVLPKGSADVVVKLEYFNPTGSYKDRMALAMIEEAERRGDLRQGMRVVEFTGGSTGSALAFVCAVKGYRFQAVCSDAFSHEKLMTMRAFGAELEIVASEGGQITKDLFRRMAAQAEELASAEDAYYTRQLHNADSLLGYGEIGRELIQQIGGPIHAFCGGVGTAGMLMGVSGALRAAGQDTRIVALEPAGSPILTGGVAGAHRIEGVGLGSMPPLLDPVSFHEARAVDEEEARATARLLAREEGIFAGTSTGMNVAAALRLAEELGTGKTVATVAVDFGLKYLSGDLYGK